MAAHPGEKFLSVSLQRSAAEPSDAAAPLQGQRWSSPLPNKWARGLKTQHSPKNAARERSRVQNLRQAFHSLQAALPSVPPDTKLSKLDVLLLATNYIAHLTETLDQEKTPTENTLPFRHGGHLHPVKKWPMRSLLYCGSGRELLSALPVNQRLPSGQDKKPPLSSPRKSDH